MVSSSAWKGSVLCILASEVSCDMAASVWLDMLAFIFIPEEVSNILWKLR